MITWKNFVTKKANWLTDTLIVNPLTALFRKQYEEFKKQQSKQKSQNTGPAPAGSSENLISQAQIASDIYRPGALSRTKTYHGGKVVAR